MSLDVERHRKRLRLMVAIVGVCVIVALVAAFGSFAYGQAWMTAVFIAALVAGFAAQIWFLAGLRRRGGEG